MLYYKDASGRVFAYDTVEDRQKYGTPDLVLLTEAEVAALSAPLAGPSPAEQIDALERQHMLPRPVRDVMLGIMEKEALAAGVSLTVLRAKNAGYRKVKELDEQIAALRVQL